VSAPRFDIQPARSAADMDVARVMFREYQQWLGVDLCFQDFDGELAGLPGKYAAPDGEIFIASDADADAVVGIVAVRQIGDPADKLSEMKRLYVREEWRGHGVGRTLANRAVAFAAKAGYQRMVLDTLTRLETAKEMYGRMGFVETEPYYNNPIPGVVYMEKIL